MGSLYAKFTMATRGKRLRQTTLDFCKVPRTDSDPDACVPSDIQPREGCTCRAGAGRAISPIQCHSLAGGDQVSDRPTRQEVEQMEGEHTTVAASADDGSDWLCSSPTSHLVPPSPRMCDDPAACDTPSTVPFVADLSSDSTFTSCVTAADDGRSVSDDSQLTSVTSPSCSPGGCRSDSRGSDSTVSTITWIRTGRKHRTLGFSQP